MVSFDIEKKWLCVYFDEVYFWCDEVLCVDLLWLGFSGSDIYVVMDVYFEVLKMMQFIGFGVCCDCFSFIYLIDKWKVLSENVVEVGYGIEWKLVNIMLLWQICIVYVEFGSLVDLVGLLCGDQLLMVDGVSVDVNDMVGVDVFNVVLFLVVVNILYSFVFMCVSGVLVMCSFMSVEVIKMFVFIVCVVMMFQGMCVGYLFFNDYVVLVEG